MAGPLEQEFKKLWTAALEGAPGMLESTFEERDDLTLREFADIVARMTGATRDGFLLVTREIDKLNATRR
jgi:hypothetical protein